ncbi:dihydroxyacetone kinase subunit DhaL [Quadrisphaera sp. DSM 44207]|uniref:dihydroxyacetone kinase subunit DhaL n=1 Tax=Quadrisphaera sp. DSM 44207 TaxID=1881057 RepID=UPI00088F0189|nr:dihydroxyacetone kinase subunit DhaL [Quadrisphaera sp. DSM 44207]SDQ37387.1 dihydroxyacetone kinase, C-terminal domain [Quadrisphaera sp. DSM 44207]
MSPAGQEDVERVVRCVARTVVAHEEEFGDLDAVAGDGDFGFSMARGFEKVLADWDAFDRTDAGTFLTKVAMTITSRIGGTSGPIWGTAFLRAGTTLKGEDAVTGEDVVAALRAAAEGIKARGGADLGDKTLLDSLVPATDALEREVAAGSPRARLFAVFAETARASADATASLQARRGRASYTGERSIGSVDAGATAVAILAEAVAQEESASSSS